MSTVVSTSGISFPFTIVNGRVQTADEVVHEQVKRATNYAVTDVPYESGHGAGINDLVFSVGTGGYLWKMVENNIKTALKKINGIQDVQVYFKKEKTTLTVNVVYTYLGNDYSYITEAGE